MLQHILYVASPKQIPNIRQAMKKLEAFSVESEEDREVYHVKHELLSNMTLDICLISDFSRITQYLKDYPVDLMIYDERNNFEFDAIEGITKIQNDMNRLGQLWGPDFHFPTSRIVAILDQCYKVEKKVFELARLKVRDVQIAPSNTELVIQWLKDILHHGIVRQNTTGMALSGGAIEGFLYQLGVLYALEKAFTGKKITDIDIYSGISSGSIASALVATDVDIEEVIRSIQGGSTVMPRLKASVLFDLNTKGIMKRAGFQAFNYLRTPPGKWLNNMIRSIPTGFFKGQLFQKRLHTIMESYGTGDDFANIKNKRLFVGCTDQDSFEHVTFGPENSSIPISKAVRASCALPPVFSPQTIHGRHYIDGQVTKSCDLELVVSEGARLVFIIDPLQPFTRLIPGSADQEGGVYGIIQTVKALISSRFETRLRAITDQFPDVDFLIFQPNDECSELMSGSPVRATFRTAIIDSAYRGTLRQLRARHHIYHTKLKGSAFT